MSPTHFHYRLLKANPELQSWVKYYWWLSDPIGSGQTDLVIPDGSSEMIFNWGSDYERGHLLQNQADVINSSCIVGQRNHSILARRLGPSRLIGIKFKPGALQRLFAIPEVEFKNQVVDFKSLQLPGLDRLEDNLYQSKSLNNAVLLIDQFLVSKLQMANPLEQRISSELISYIQRGKGALTLKEVQSHFNLHPKKLERLFSQYVGLSPKNYLRITRFKNVYKQVNRQAVDFYDQSVFDWGYYDQMHFIKEFKAFTGQSPSDYYQGKGAVSDKILTDTLSQLKKAV